VVLEPDETVIGNLEEDFAIESMAGDIFQLGNHAWRIRRVEAGRVRVEDAHGQSPTIPFWLGEGPARTIELSSQVSRLRQGLAVRLGQAPPSPPRPQAHGFLADACSVPADAADLMCDYLTTGWAQLGAVPTDQRVVIERFFDEAGGMQLCLHAPFGGRIN